MPVCAPTRREFRALLQIAQASVADPPWFATPVEAHEDDDWLTIVFHVPALKRRRVRVESTDQSLTIWGNAAGRQRRSLRVCSLPCEIDRSRIETARSGDLLRVRLAKKRRAVASTSGTHEPPTSEAA